MFTLILGGSKTGKSRYGEALAVRLCNAPTQGRLLYIATMIPVGDGEEGAACVARHRAQRAGLGFVTLEQPLDLGLLSPGPRDVVLLEDVSNLVANHLFAEGGSGSADIALEEIRFVADRCAHLLAVSFHGLAASSAYDEETNRYIGELNRINSRLTQLADAVVLMENGQPTSLKGKLP